MPVRFREVLTRQRAIDRGFPPFAAAGGANFFADSGTKSPRFGGLTNGTWHVSENNTVSIGIDMRTNLFIKVIVEHDPKEIPEKLGAELCRQLEKNYLVRRAELSSVAPVED
jgi:hypothetical protein